MRETVGAVCPWCTARGPAVVADRTRTMVACASCGAWFVWPPPSAGAVAQHYAASERGMPERLRAMREETVQSRWYAHLAEVIDKRAAQSKLQVHTVADIGAGGLELTHALAERFPSAQIEAWDLTASVTEEPRVISRAIDLNRPESWPDDLPRFDVVACVAVIEHVLDPLSLLRLLRRITAPGGFAYVAGPDVGSFARRVLGRHWPYYCPDEHLTLPTLASVARAVSICGGGAYTLRRIPVRYSLRYVLRYLRFPFSLPTRADVLLPIPSGAFELVWDREG
jgi:SAM-dependent methyltransferase